MTAWLKTAAPCKFCGRPRGGDPDGVLPCEKCGEPYKGETQQYKDKREKEFKEYSRSRIAEALKMLDQAAVILGTNDYKEEAKDCRDLSDRVANRVNSTEGAS